VGLAAMAKYGQAKLTGERSTREVRSLGSNGQNDTTNDVNNPATQDHQQIVNGNGLQVISETNTRFSMEGQR